MNIGRILLIGLASVCCFHVSSARSEVKVIDFDGPNADQSLVGGATLNQYLAGYGVSIHSKSPQDANVWITSKSNSPFVSFVPQSGNNALVQIHPAGSPGNGAAEYVLAFATPVTRADLWIVTPYLTSQGNYHLPGWEISAINIECGCPVPQIAPDMEQFSQATDTQTAAAPTSLAPGLIGDSTGDGGLWYNSLEAAVTFNAIRIRGIGTPTGSPLLYPNVMIDSLTLYEIPEPASLMFVAAGAGLVLTRRRRRAL